MTDQMAVKKHEALQNFRMDRPGTPHIWCPGCGIGQIWHYSVKAIDELGLDKDKVLWVGGSGCTGRMATYWNRDYFHTLHGRAIGFATGAKLANPDLNILVHSGDGEAVAIGGNHLIQAARRNVDLNLIIVNNFNFGMTGSQFSPTTPQGTRTATSPFGNVERPFRLCELMKECGATYVARYTTAQPREVIKSIKKGIQNKGFSFTEIISQGPTCFGRANNMGDPGEMLDWFKEKSLSIEEAEGMTREEQSDYFVIGEFADREAPEFTTELAKVSERAREEKKNE